MRESVPLYKQLKSELLEHIREGHWKPGEQLPSEAELAVQFRVSRTTVRQAVGDLVSSGFVVRRQGKGTYVAPRTQASSATALYGFAEALRSNGLDVRMQIDHLDTLAAYPSEVEHRLEIPHGRKILEIERTAWVNDVCYFHEQSFVLPPFHMDLSYVIEHREAFDYIYGYLEANGVRINSGHQTVGAQLATEADCTLFKLVSPSPVLVIERLTRDESGAAVEFSRVRYPGDRYQFAVNLLRRPDA